MVSLMQLAGRQLLPNVLASLAFSRHGLLQRNVILHTDHPTESLNPAMRLFELLGLDPFDDDGIHRVLVQVDDVLQSVHAEALALFDEFPQDRWVLHATGGNKMMSAAFILLATDPRVHGVIYRDIRGGWRQVAAPAGGLAPHEIAIDPADPVLGCLADTSVALDQLPLLDVLRAQFAADDSIDTMTFKELPLGVDPASWVAHVAGGARGFASHRSWTGHADDDGTAFECWLGLVLREAGACQVAWGCEGLDPRRNKVMETDVIALHGNRMAFFDVKLEKPEASRKSEQIRSARGTADKLGGLSAAAVLVRPNWPSTPHIERFAQALGVQLIGRGNIARLVDLACAPLGLQGHISSHPRLRRVRETLERIDRSRGRLVFSHR